MRWKRYAGTGIAAATCEITGGLASGADSANNSYGPGSLYYRVLRKPSWQPPGAVFPVVWTALYTDIAVTTGYALTELDERPDRREYDQLARALGANLVLNTLWTWLFFRWRRRLLGTIECAALAVSSIDLVRRVARVDRRAGAALAPYAAWCSFATVLSATITKLNSGAS